MKPQLKNLCLSAAMCLSLSAALTPALVQAQSGNDGQQRGGRGGPPPQEAFDACASLQANDSCTVETPNETLSGSCQQTPREDQLLCVPAR